MIPSRGPTIITVRPVNKSGGINCCCCKCCTCLNLQFLKNEPGLLKIVQVLLGSFCQSLALNYGMGYSNDMGASFQSFLTAVAWCIMTTSLLLFCYVISEKTCSLVRQSLFETVFNSVASFSYLSSCSWLGYVVYIFLKPKYLVTPYFQAYPAMSAAYMVGGLVGIVHGYDAYKCYRYYKGYR
ncbi:protein singles bar [Zophobas morio]|uniref:protein singles bar n=1 Tax=Zophobas morio TaxID=2755281 RepID=UPI00308270C6